MSGYPKALAQGWFPIAAVSQLGRRPLARQLMDRPLVVFRTPSGPAVLVDRCPHRNIALSRGRVREGDIECPYHGWRFNGAGTCTLTPGADLPARHAAEALPVLVRQGLIWTTLSGAAPPFPRLPDPIEVGGFDTFWWPVRASRARWMDAVENLLDPAHPHFVHAGIVRSGGAVRKPVEVTVRLTADRAEAIYLENSRPTALIPRLLEGVRATSIGRYYPPTIGQVAFEGPDGPRLAITVIFTPESQDRVRPFAHFATPKGRAPAWLKAGVLRLLNAPVLAQDRDMLRAQAADVARFGAPRYALGPLDILLPAIQRLAAGEAPEPETRTVQMRL